MRVGKLGRCLDLSQESLGTYYGCEFRFKDLERHIPVVALVVGQIDRSHPALADLAIDAVAALQGGVKADDRIFDHPLKRWPFVDG